MPGLRAQPDYWTMSLPTILHERFRLLFVEAISG